MGLETELVVGFRPTYENEIDANIGKFRDSIDVSLADGVGDS